MCVFCVHEGESKQDCASCNAVADFDSTWSRKAEIAVTEKVRDILQVY